MRPKSPASPPIVYSTVYSDADQRKHQSSASPAFVRVIHRSLVNSPHTGPLRPKMFPFDDVIMKERVRLLTGQDSLEVIAAQRVPTLPSDRDGVPLQGYPGKKTWDSSRRAINPFSHSLTHSSQFMHIFLHLECDDVNEYTKGPKIITHIVLECRLRYDRKNDENPPEINGFPSQRDSNG